MFVDSERRVLEDISIKTPKGYIRSRIGGSIDRMDLKGDTLRIVDYKTGGDAVIAADVEALFTPAEKRPNYIFQTFLYSSLMCNELRRLGKPQKVSPALLYIHRAASDDYNPTVQMGKGKEKTYVDDFSLYEREFRERLTALLEEIFNPDTSFNQTEDVSKCEYCDFKDLCKR